MRRSSSFQRGLCLCVHWTAISSCASWVMTSCINSKTSSCYHRMNNRLDQSHSRSLVFRRSATTEGMEYTEDDLMEMDVVVFSTMIPDDTKAQSSKRQLGAVQEDGRITPLCVWTTEPAFDESLEFLVDEEDLLPGYRVDKEVPEILIMDIVPQDKLSYGSRQVGGGMGPGNPHGEESELLYYIDASILDDVEVIVKPELEIFW